MTLKDWLNQRVEFGSLPAWVVIAIPLICATLFFGHAHYNIVSDIYDGMNADLSPTHFSLHHHQQNSCPDYHSTYDEYRYMTHGREQGKFFVYGSHTDLYYNTYQDAFTRAVRDRIEVHKDFLRVVLPQNHNLNLGKCELPQVPRICSSKEIAKVTNEVKTYIAAEEAVFAEYEKNKTNRANVDNLKTLITQTDEKIAKVSNYLTEEVPATSIVIDFNKLVGNRDLI